MALAKLPRPGDREMLLALIIGAAAVVAFICSFAMFLQYMREDADDDDNSKRPAGVNRVRSVAEGQAGPALAQEGPKMTVLIYVKTSKHVGDPDHLKGLCGRCRNMVRGKRSRRRRV